MAKVTRRQLTQALGEDHSLIKAIEEILQGYVPGGVSVLITVTPLENSSGALTATMTNAPVSGNPTKWITINDAGVLRRIPAW